MILVRLDFRSFPEQRLVIEPRFLSMQDKPFQNIHLFWKPL